MNTSQLLQTLGLLLQAPSMYQQAKIANDKIREQKLTEQEIKSGLEALTSPLPDFLIKGGRSNLARKLMAKAEPDKFIIDQYERYNKPKYSIPFEGRDLEFDDAGDYLLALKRMQETPSISGLPPDIFEKMKKDPSAVLKFFDFDRSGEAFNAAQALGFLPKDKTGNEKDKFPIEIGGKTYYTTSNEIYIDYLTKKGRFAPDDNKITQGLKDAQTLASLRAMEIGKNLDDMEPKDAADLIMKSGRELNPDFDKTIGGDVLVVKRPKDSFLGGTKSFYFWGEDKEEILAAQKALKNGVMTPAEYEDFLKVMTGE